MDTGIEERWSSYVQSLRERKKYARLGSDDTSYENRDSRLSLNADELSLKSIISRVSITDPWAHTTPEQESSRTGRPSTARYFRPGRQRWRVFFSGIPELLLTIILCIGLFLVYYFYSRKDVLTKADQLKYNYLSLLLYLVLPISIAASFKTFARSYRWHLLSTRYLGLAEFDLVLGCESLIASVELLWKGRTKGRMWPSRIQWYCGLSLLINLGLQFTVSALGLVVGLEISELGIDRSERGDFTVADFEDITYLPIDNRSMPYIVSQMIPFNKSYLEAYFPNFYGNLIWPPPNNLTDGLIQVQRNISDSDNRTSAIFCASTNSSCMIFLSNGGTEIGKTRTIVMDYYSTRTLSAHATCVKHPVTDFMYGLVVGLNNLTSISYRDGNVTFVNQTTGQNQTMPWSVFPPILGEEWFTWAVNPDTAGDNPRSANVLALLFADDGTALFDCNSTVLPMSGSTNPNIRTLPDRQANAFAGAIAGRMRTIQDDPKIYAQYSAMLDDSLLTGGHGYYAAEDIAYVIRMFTMGALRSFDDFGPRTSVAGTVPQQAQTLKVKWRWVTAILAGIPMTQFFLLCGTAYVSSKAVIKDTSYLAAAQLLKPVVEKLGPHGCIMSGSDIAQHLGNLPVVYGVRIPPRSSDHLVYHADLIQQSEAVAATVGGGGWRPGLKMPKGWYDGLGVEDTEVRLTSSGKNCLDCRSRPKVKVE